MRYLQKMCIYAVLLGGCFLSTNEAFAAGSPDVQIDGYNIPVQVWHDTGSINTGFLQIIGKYGEDDAVPLTDAESFHAYNPIVAASLSSSASVLGVAVWQAYDFSGMIPIPILQAAVLTTGFPNAEWQMPVTTLSLIGESPETPFSDYKVSISVDGTVIVVTWSSFLNDETVVRRIIGTSVGTTTTWSSPETIN